MANTEGTQTVWYFIPNTNTRVTGVLLGYAPGSTTRVRVRRDTDGVVIRLPLSVVRPIN